MFVRGLFNDPGLDVVALDVRRSQIARSFSLMLTAAVSVFNIGPLASLAWLSASMLCQGLTHWSSGRALADGSVSLGKRMAFAGAMLLETAIWDVIAVLYWKPGNLAFCILAICVIAGQLIHAQAFVARSKLALLACSVPPALTLIVLPTWFSGFHGAAQMTAFLATTMVVYYSWVSASAHNAISSALEQQQQYARGVIEAIDSRIGIIDAEGHFVHTNRAWRERIETIERRTNRRLGSHFSEHCGRIAGRKGRFIEAQLRALLDRRIDTFSTLYRADVEGATQWFELQAYRLKGAGAAKVFVIQNDVTALKASEAQLRITNRTLRRARLEAESANRAKSKFLATMGHEIRTPLNGIVAITDVLSRAPLAEAERDLVQTIMASADTLSGLLVDMLDVARIEAGRVSLESKAFHLGDALGAVVALSEVIVSEKNIVLDIRIDPGVEVWVMGDLTRFKQVITNLISNAVKFTDRGSVSVVAQRNADGAFEITVADTGIGFDDNQIERLFNPFEQADDSISRRFGGTGLGLAIVKQLIELMGGMITCESQVDQGSVFKIVLPLQTTTNPGTAAEPSLADITGGTPLMVLVVDDHPVNRKVVSLILSPADVQLVMAENGEQAIEAFQEQRFDAVLMDIQMPVMDGLAATQVIRQIEQAQGLGRTPVIMFSANALTEHIEQSLAAGADMHLAKPITAQGLLGALATVLHNAPAQATGPLISA